MCGPQNKKSPGIARAVIKANFELLRSHLTSGIRQKPEVLNC